MKNIILELMNGLVKDSSKKSSVDKIYKIHKYWARKPWYVVDKYIEKYSRKGDLVLDPFCGSGLTGVEANSLERDFIGIDLNPMSIRISQATNFPLENIKSLEADFNLVKLRCKDKILALYTTDSICPKCGQMLYEKHTVCGGENVGKSAVYCECGKRTSQLINSNIDRCDQTLDETYWVPETEMPQEFFKDRFSYKGIKKVKDFFTPRALSSLSFILDSIKKLESDNEEFLIIAFSNTLLHCSKLKGENVRPMSVNNYWLPNDIIDENVWFRFEDRFNNVLESKKALLKRKDPKERGKYTFIHGSALNSNNYTKADYIFTDPPYGETIQYSELSFVWNAWLDQSYEIKEEIIINPVQKKSQKEFGELLHISLSNIYESLKRGKYFTLCFANKEFIVWKDTINFCKKLGFQLDSIEAYDTYGSPYNKNWSKFSPKTDLYVTFKKIAKSDKYQSINYEYDIKTLLDLILDTYFSKDLEVDIYKLYDLTVSAIIWLMFYNKKSFKIEDFDLKTFSILMEDRLRLKRPSS
ncbi:MAG: hypothetical protein K9L02_05645 [Acholeplasmataceae bacterium]|nr:hypothetical protein [Acholeplasmataceae bacterium]